MSERQLKSPSEAILVAFVETPYLAPMSERQLASLSEAILVAFGKNTSKTAVEVRIT